MFLLTFDLCFDKIYSRKSVFSFLGRLMEQNIIKFTGSNDKLFTRVVVDKLTPKLTLIVPETHNAILIKDGQMLQTLSSGRFLLADFFDLKTDLESAIEILFMSKTAKLKLLWGTPSKLLMFDENLQEDYHAGFSGDFEVQIGDPRKCYLYLVGASQDLTAGALQERLLSNVVSVMETVVVEYLRQNKVPFNQIAVHKKEISQKVLSALSHKLLSEYGIAVFSFNIANIIIDPEDHKRLSALVKKGAGNQEIKTTCRRCGTTLKEGVKFCSECGAPVDAGKICTNCSSENDANAKFCSTCGQKL